MTYKTGIISCVPPPLRKNSKCMLMCQSVQHLTHSLNTSLPTSSKDENSDFPTLGILPFIASCFTLQCVYQTRKTNLNTPAALAVTGIIVFVIKGVRPPWQSRPRLFWANEAAVNLSRSPSSWQPEKHQIQPQRTQTAGPGQDKMKHATNVGQ